MDNSKGLQGITCKNVDCIWTSGGVKRSYVSSSGDAWDKGWKDSFLQRVFFLSLLPPLVYQDSEDGRDSRETFFVPVS